MAEEILKDLISIVPMELGVHMNFLLDGVLKSGRVGFSGKHSLTTDYYAWQEPYWKRVICHEETIAFVAEVTEGKKKNEDRQFAGFVIGGIQGTDRRKKGVLHYIYVKQSMRKFGIAKLLLDTLPKKVEYYSTMPMGWAWRKSRELDWKYEPHGILAKVYGEHSHMVFKETITANAHETL